MAATIAPEPSREAERGKKALFTKLSLYGLKFAKFKVHLWKKKKKGTTPLLFLLW